MNVIDSNSLYYYGYPGDAFNDSKETVPFYNKVPFHTVERKVASRLGTMGVNYINFDSNSNSQTEEIYDLFGFDLKKQQLFSKEVEGFSTLLEKDYLIKRDILDNFEGKLVYQAQAYSDYSLIHKYDESCLHSLRLNDKLNLDSRIPSNMLLPKSLSPYDSYPFIGKLSRASAGDATDIIKCYDDLKSFQEKFKNLSSKIPLFYETFKAGKEYGLEFFRSAEGKFDVIALVESAVDANNSYLGGKITVNNKDNLTNEMSILADAIKSYFKKINWNGRGGIDIIEDENGNIFVIDPNIRTTQIMPAAWDMYRNNLSCNMLYSSFSIDISDSKWIDNLRSVVKKGVLKGYSGTFYKDKFYGDGAIMYDQKETLENNRKELFDLGVLFS